MSRRLGVLASLSALLLLIAGCGGGHRIEERETGYRGKARLDPYLAAARFLQHYGYQVESRPGWPKPGPDTSVMVVPMSVLNTQAFVREVDQWVQDGGHLVCLGERAESWHDDWRDHYQIRRDPGDEGKHDDVAPPPCRAWLERAGLKVDLRSGEDLKAESVVFDDKRFEIAAGSAHEVRETGGRPRVLGHVDYGHGCITVLTDARPFRNRYIDEHDHAALLLAIVHLSPYSGAVLFVRDASLSFWELLWRHGWPALCGLAAVIAFWLWRNMPRYGPLAAEEEISTLRAYDHHLEALGDFHWRLDKAAGLLRPLRESVLERAQQQAAAAGHRDGDLFEWLAHRAGITRERAQRAMTHEVNPDPATFSRTLADLQTLHLSLS